MKRILVCLCSSLMLCSGLLAQQNPADTPATKEDVQQYLQAIHSHEMVQQVVKAMSAPMQKMIHEEYLKHQDSLPADFEATVTRMVEEMLRDMPWDEMFEAMIPAYEKHFTKGDMQALTAFYSTPTGQKILRELPAVTAESMQTMMPIMQRYIAKVTDRVQHEMEAKLQESRKAPAASTPATRN